jgi:hypothetical protein
MKLYASIVILVLVFICNCNALEQETQPIRATDFIGHGFDLYSGEFLSEKSGEGIKALPIFDFVYGKKVWRYPGSDVPYAIPTDVAVASNPFVKEIVLQSTYNSYHSYLVNYSSWFHFGVDFQYGAFKGGLKYNQELGKIQSEMSDKTKELMMGYHRINLYSASLYMPEIMTLDEQFIKSVAVLPDTIKDEDDEAKYRHFVQAYGTHYVFSALFGAKVNFDAFVAAELQDRFEKKWVSREYGMYFHYMMFNISNGGYQNRSSIKISTEFTKQTQSQSFFYGGDPGQAHVDSIRNWTQTINGYEYPFNVTLNEISELIPEKVKRLTMKSYVRDYVNRNKAPKRDVVDDESPICLGKGFDPLTVKCVGQVLDLTRNPTFKQDFTESDSTSFETLMVEEFDGEMWQHSYKKSHKFLGFGKKSKETYDFFKNHLEKKKSYDAKLSTLTYERHTMAVTPQYKLSTQMEAALRVLPKIYVKSDPEIKLKYFHFLQSHGYAFVDEVYLGGQKKIQNFFDTSYVYTKGINWVKEKSSWSILKIVGSNKEKNVIYQNVDKDFDKTCQISYDCIGGSNCQNTTEWISSIKNNLAPVKFNLQPITSVIADKILAASIDAAYLDYVYEAEHSSKEYFADRLHINSLNL